MLPIEKKFQWECSARRAAAEASRRDVSGRRGRRPRFILLGRAARRVVSDGRLCGAAGSLRYCISYEHCLLILTKAQAFRHKAFRDAADSDRCSELICRREVLMAFGALTVRRLCGKVETRESENGRSISYKYYETKSNHNVSEREVVKRIPDGDLHSTTAQVYDIY
ncbi:hypothetical protein EVAR_56557_1 [Eumeta japonica]|uniref:Uncharacterized protein n=1 Tax=Eumeta variegata TaxID=151549 RepID=A0A4C1ZUR8_EUMVA|nr:hypothetical protein EVAR_56557_1 [Eumeta japonica]